eukprot:COSAG01_NODE_3459_length_6071_cov_34.889317_6_plen_79_part_00
MSCELSIDHDGGNRRTDRGELAVDLLLLVMVVVVLLLLLLSLLTRSAGPGRSKQVNGFGSCTHDTLSVQSHARPAGRM